MAKKSDKGFLFTVKEYLKKSLFFVLMLLIPVAFFVLLELGLRLFGFGDSYPLVKTAEIFGKERYVVNTEVGRRYFNLPPDKTPQPLAEYFDIEKPEKTMRLFCVGGSTTAGFPFEMNVTFPFQLQYRLRNELFDGWAEAVNLGIAAVNSYTVLDLLPEVLELQPDGLIVYMGHNEFYGAMGVGSTQNVGNNRTLIRWYLQLRRMRTFQLMQQIIGWISPAAAGDAEQQKSMMHAMAGEQTIPLNSGTFETACDNFAANLTEIVQLAKAKNVPIILCTLVSNLKDQRPFVADFSADLDERARRRADRLLTETERLLASGYPEAALKTFGEIMEIDTTHALAYYLAGQVHLALGDSVAAQKSFVLAKDFDLLRFRAPEKFNEIITEIAMSEDVPLVDMASVFRAGSAKKITGKELFLEHLHPNFDGYRLMAQTLTEALRTIQIINPPKPIGWQRNLITPKIPEILNKFRTDDGGVTDLDLEFGYLRNFWLINRWPFPEKNVTLANYAPHSTPETRTIAIKRFENNSPWEQSHYEMAEIYAAREQYKLAELEYRAVRLRFVENVLPVMKMGDMNMLNKDFKNAIFWYEKALEMTPDNLLISARLGRSFAALNNFNAARKHLTKALSGDDADEIFTVLQRTEMYYLLGVSCANLRDFPAAEAALQQSLKLMPDYPSSRELMSKIRVYQHQNQ